MDHCSRTDGGQRRRRNIHQGGGERVWWLKKDNKKTKKQEKHRKIALGCGGVEGERGRGERESVGWKNLVGLSVLVLTGVSYTCPVGYSWA